MKRQPKLEDYERIGIKLRALSALSNDVYCDIAQTLGKDYVYRSLIDTVLKMQQKADTRLYTEYCDDVRQDNDEFRWNCIFGPMWENEKDVVIKTIFKNAGKGSRNGALNKGDKNVEG